MQVHCLAQPVLYATIVLFILRGARRTAMWIDPQNGLGLVILVERFDMTGEEQKVFYGSFLKAAIAQYGRGRSP